MTQTSSQPPVPRRRFRKWFARGLLALVLLLVLIGVFHRPILRGVIGYVVPKAAATLGIKLDLEVDGSILKDLQIRHITAKAAEDHWLPRLQVEQLAAFYDLKAILKGNMEQAVQKVTLHGVDAQADLRRLPASEKEEKEPAVEAGKPPLVWPDTIDLKSINATVILADGRKLVIRGLTLQIGEGMPGILACEELHLDGTIDLKNVAAQIDWQPRKITIRNLALPKDVTVEELAVDLTGWDDEKVAATGKARMGSAALGLDIKAAGITSAVQQIEANIHARQLRADELRIVGIPEDVKFEGGELDLQLSGSPQDTHGLKGELQVVASDVRAAGAMLDRVDVKVRFDQALATLDEARLTRGGNVITATGKAELPANLADWQKIRWNVQVDGGLTNIAEILANPPPLQGSYQLQAKAEGVGATPTKVTSELKADALRFGSYNLPQLQTRVGLDGKQAVLEIPDLALGEGNKGNVKATLAMDDAMPVEAKWNFTITNPASFFSTTGIAPPPEAISGNLQTTGHAQFNIREITANDFTKLVADISLSGQEIHYAKGVIHKVDVQAHAEAGKAHINAFNLQVDEKNHIELTGDAELKAPFVFNVNGGISLADLTSLNVLLQSFNAPPFESGSLFVKLDGEGQLQPWQSRGKASLTAAKVRTSQMPESADAVLDTNFEGKQATLNKLEATLGPWKVSAQGKVDDKQVNIAELKVWQKTTILLNGHAQVPFDVLASAQGQPMDVNITAKDLRIHEILEAAGIKDIPAGTLNADVKLQGRERKVAGNIHVNLANVSVPNAPKSFKPSTTVLDVTLADGRAKVLLTVAQPPLQNLKLTAESPIDIVELAKNPGKFQETPIAAHLDMPESDLSFLRDYAPDMIRSIPARMSIKADVSGKVGEPIIKADLQVNAREVAWTSANLPSVRDVKVSIKANDRKISVEDISVVLAGGQVRITGGVDAANLQEPTVNLRINANEALVFRDPTSSLRANANVTCEGTLKAARVSGVIELVRGRIFKEIDLTPALSLPSDVPPLPPDTQRNEGGLPIPEMMSDWTFDVVLRTRDPILVAGNLANGAVSVNASFTGTGANPVLTGGGNVDRLLLKLPYSMVKITKGVITLNPAKPLDPALDLRGESRVGNNDITLYVYGDSSAPKTRFTSIPPLPESDIVTLLATGTTLSGSSSEAAAEAASRAALLYVTDLYRKVFNKKKVVREEPPKLNITFNPSVATNPNTTASDQVQVTYDLSENWRIRGGFGQNGRARAFLAYVLRFGKAARAVDEEAVQLPQTQVGQQVSK